MISSIILAASDEFVGLCAAISIDATTTEIGYRLRESYWRRGFGTEVVGGLINYLFTTTDKQRLVAEVAIRNIGSVRILDKFMTKVREVLPPV